MQALVTKSTGSWYKLLLPDGREAEARIKGKLKLLGLRTTNPLAVGDRVHIIPEPGSEHYIITGLLPRNNYIIRKSNNLSRESHILAANLDLACLVISPVAPTTSSGFIDRFLVTAEAYHIPVLLIYNKVDIYGMEVYQEISALYHQLGYPSIAVSAISGSGMESLKELLKQKTTLFTGHSGVGKTSLINRLISGLERKTAAVSDMSLKGKHTTTFAEMLISPEDFKIIDTPGIRELGIIDITENELSHYFPEMRNRLQNCKFNNCRHVSEPGCAILQALEQGEISKDRYYNYLSILRNEDVMN